MDERAEDLVLPVLRSRWSPRMWDPGHELSAVELEALLEAARWAPSAGNSQPWLFLMGRRGDPTHEVICEFLAPSSRAWAPMASALIITAYQRFVPDSDLPYSDYAAYDLGQAVAHLTIQAQGMGMHTRQFAAFDHEGMARRFALPGHWEVATGIAVGQLSPAAVGPTEGAERQRRPVTDLVHPLPETPD